MIGVGGYASGPAMLAGAMLRVPLMAFEPNVVPGVANRLVARWVQAAAVHFPATQQYFSQCCRHRGPCAPASFSTSPRDQPKLIRRFSSSAEARGRTPSTLRSPCPRPISPQEAPGLHFIHQTGQNDFEAAKAAASSAGISAEVSAFIDDMPAAFARADLLICRSGASTVAEVAAAGKPAIFIPLPTAADDHQRHNAETLANAGAATLLPQSELTSDRLAQEVAALLATAPISQRMGTAAREFAHPDAAAEIAAMAARLAGISRPQHVA